MTLLTRSILLALAIISSLATTTFAQDGEVLIGDVCRVKGQEENSLMATGIVVGLKGTGDDSVVTQRALARYIQLLGGQIGVDQKGLLQAQELKDAKNVAMVIVQATIPAGGAQQGDRLKCTVSAISAKSLEGGTLLLTPMTGPRPDQPMVYALASGLLDIPDPKTPTMGSIQMGAKMEADIINGFTKGDTFTLVIDSDHSSFKMAQEVAFAINSKPDFGGTEQNPSSRTKPSEPYAVAKGQMHVEVRIPPAYANEQQKCIDMVLDIPLSKIVNRKRVVIMERQGIIVIGEDVTIAPVVISHANMVNVSTKGNPAANKFTPVSTEASPDKRPKLKNLVDSLNVLDVPTRDIIGIIKAIKKEGALYGELVIE